MSNESLATKYRPQTWNDVVEQGSTKIILQNQLKTNTVKHAYLFVGGAGTGKTTCARIFANEINNNIGEPIELDAASNSSVDDVRELIHQSKTQSLESEYKVFIIDECHSLSDKAWQAFLKILEEPPAKSVFIFCTTNPEKIPLTIISRVQRFTFKRISQDGIVHRLEYIADNEPKKVCERWDDSALDYLAKLSDGGMRDAITLMDKCLSYSNDLTLDVVMQAVGGVDYDAMIDLTTFLIIGDAGAVIESIEKIHLSGIDLKFFVRQYLSFILDANKYVLFKTFNYIQIPQTETNEKWLDGLDKHYEILDNILSTVININTTIKYDSSPKYLIEAMLLEVIR